MGTFGFRPIDNDGAMDLEYEMKEAHGKAIADLFSRRGTSQDRWERIGVLINAIMNGVPVKKTLITKAINDLNYLDTDTEWLSGWTDKTLIHNSIKIHIKIFTDVLREQRHDSTVYLSNVLTPIKYDNRTSNM